MFESSLWFHRQAWVKANLQEPPRSHKAFRHVESTYFDFRLSCYEPGERRNKRAGPDEIDVERRGGDL